MGNILLSAVGIVIAIALCMLPKRAEGAQKLDLERQLRTLRERESELERMSELLKARAAKFPRVFARNENLKTANLERQLWVAEELKTLREEQLRLLKEKVTRLKNAPSHEGSGRKH